MNKKQVFIGSEGYGRESEDYLFSMRCGASI